MNLARSWWNWCSESFAHMFLGVTAPILIIAGLAVLLFASTYSSTDSANSPQAPRSDIAGVCLEGTSASRACVTSTPTTVAVTTATRVPPTQTPPPRTYTVVSGDTLYRICAAEVPAMPSDDCVYEIAGLNNLEDVGELYPGQVLEIPPAGSTRPTSARRIPTPTPIPDPVEAYEPEEEAEPEPEPEPQGGASAILVAIGPANTWLGGTAADSSDAEEIEQAASYVVQSGDSLLGICVNQVPGMDEDECIAFIVLLNDLDGPNQIRSGQALVLP